MRKIFCISSGVLLAFLGLYDLFVNKNSNLVIPALLGALFSIAYGMNSPKITDKNS